MFFFHQRDRGRDADREMLRCPEKAGRGSRVDFVEGREREGHYGAPDGVCSEDRSTFEFLPH